MMMLLVLLWCDYRRLLKVGIACVFERKYLAEGSSLCHRKRASARQRVVWESTHRDLSLSFRAAASVFHTISLYL